MSAPGPRTTGAPVREEPFDPVQMSVAEKLACEWEARHDVAARGRINDVAPVQHYLTHARCEDGLHRPAGHETRAPRTARAETAAARSAGLRQWLRWGEEGPPGVAPVIPRC